MYVFQTPQHLVQEKLVMVWRQVVVRLDYLKEQSADKSQTTTHRKHLFALELTHVNKAHLMQVRLHQLENHIDVLEFSRPGRQHYVFNFDNVCAGKISQVSYWRWVPTWQHSRASRAYHCAATAEAT